MSSCDAKGQGVGATRCWGSHEFQVVEQAELRRHGAAQVIEK